MPKNKRNTPEFLWEEELLGAYYDYNWHQVLDPLYDKMQLWKTGGLEHEDINKAVHETHKETQRLYGLFTNKRDFLLFIARQTEDFFQPWLAGHPAPPGVVIKNCVRHEQADYREAYRWG